LRVKPAGSRRRQAVAGTPAADSNGRPDFSQLQRLDIMFPDFGPQDDRSEHSQADGEFSLFEASFLAPSRGP
ncbi:MAG TPA: hypothetical protein VGR16_12040, partial [Thermomicrobiales bacterium]|nr:hypothetical protein [Thermomicrobiales bacterium]